MPEKPLLIFPSATVVQRIKAGPSFFNKSYNFPDFDTQKDRLTPQFQSMQQSFITDTSEGLEPEKVLVIETCGQVENFQRAVKHIPGLEWLTEIDEEFLPPDEYFYKKFTIGKTFFLNRIVAIDKIQSLKLWEILKENNFIDKDNFSTGRQIDDFTQSIPSDLFQYNHEIIKSIKDEELKVQEQPITGRFFISISNKQAIDKLISLWDSWDSKDKKLPTNYGSWVEIFKHIRKIRKWGIRDRLRETGIIEQWNEEIETKRGTASKIIFELELWYRNNNSERKKAKENIVNLVIKENGRIINECLINDIRFHAMKIELPIENVEKAINGNYTQIFSCEDIMFFRPNGQFRFLPTSEGIEGSFESVNISGEPIVAIFDSVPFSHHELFRKNNLIIDDPDNFDGDSPSKSRNHGTAMASLICYGELNTHSEPLKRPVYFRPIMKPDTDHPEFIEEIPKEYFFEDLVERSVRRLFESENDELPLYPTIKIINLSICDRIKMYFNSLSSCARLLDWLSYKYKILFCVSAGNIGSEINLEKDIVELKSLSGDELINITVKNIYKDMRNRRILSPGDSINSLTIGSIHSDKSIIDNLGNRIDILPDQNLPSPFSAHGPGFKNSIKPELYLPGGRQLFDVDNRNICITSKSVFAPGQSVAKPSVTGGEINRYAYTCGTSNSTALASRSVAIIYEMLNTLGIENAIQIDEANIAVILKTLFVHSAFWNEGRNILERILKSDDNKWNFKRILAQYMGYGIPDVSRVLECTSQRATVIGYGKIKKDEKHDFRFPLPPCLSGINEKRRLIYTLAWFSPVNSGNRKYRKANLSIEPLVEKLGVDRINADWQQVKNGTVQHEVLEGNKVMSYQDGDYLEISVVCREDSESLFEEVPYGLAVTLEIGASIELPIYEEIKERISIPIKIEEEIL